MMNSSFGLREEPFGTDLPLRAPFASAAHREAFNGFFLAILARRRLMALFGETGIGKSTLLRALISHVDSDGAVVLAVTAQPGMSVEDIILGASPTLEDAPPQPVRRRPESDLEAVVAEMENRIENAGTGLLIIDEAQRLDLGVVQDLVELASSDTETGRFLQILLSGDHMLERMLADPSIEQALRSAGVTHHLPPLDEEDADAFVRERLRLSGAEQDDLFEPAAISAAASLSGGLPGVLNALCRQAFRSAAQAGEPRVTAERMFRAADDLGIEPPDGIDTDFDIPDFPAGEVPEPVRRVQPAGRGPQDGTPRRGGGPAPEAASPPPPPPQRPVIAEIPGWQAAAHDRRRDETGPKPQGHEVPPPFHTGTGGHAEAQPPSLRADRYRDGPADDRRRKSRPGRAVRAVAGIAAVAGLAGLGLHLFGEEDMLGTFRQTRDFAATPAQDMPEGGPEGGPAGPEASTEPRGGYESLIPRMQDGAPSQTAGPSSSGAPYAAAEADAPTGSAAAPPPPEAPGDEAAGSPEDADPRQVEALPPLPAAPQPEPEPVQSAALPPPTSAPEQLREPDSVQPDPAQPDPSQAVEREVETLAARADRQIGEKLLTTPTGDNAYETYRRIVELAPGHPAAASILARIKDTYRDWAVAAENRGEFDNARRFYERGLSVDPQDGDFRRRLATLEERRQQETATAEAPEQPPEPLPASATPAPAPDPEHVLRLPPGYVEPGGTEPDEGTQGAVAAASPPPAPPLPAPNAFASRDDMLAAINQPDMLRAVIEAGRNLDRELPDGKTALMLAAERGRSDAVRMLLEGGAAPNARSRNGGTALMYAASVGDERAIRALIRHGGAVNAMNVDGKTALMAAAQAGHAGTVRLLLDSGAEVNARSVQGLTALDYAGEAGQRQVITLLRLRGAEPAGRETGSTAGEPPAPRPGGPLDLRAFRG